MQKIENYSHPVQISLLTIKNIQNVPGWFTKSTRQQLIGQNMPLCHYIHFFLT